MREAYHTALADGRQEPVAPCDRWEGDGCEAFVHDFLSGPLPKAYDRCDLLWAEPPWPAGFHRFEDRAGINGDHGVRTWQMLLTHLEEVRQGTPKAFILNRSKHRWLPRPDQIVPSRLNGHHCTIWCYGLALNGNTPKDSKAVLETLTATYNVVGDPMCGYGRAGRVFKGAGKRFVMSDYNPHCIGYVAAHAPSW